ncbi:acetate--CoA ligase family protein [Candidatus Formimonas warabiya]|uniref:CoA-binding domain-containing protein n=1 Tax=Formimonas warabiya TaxID=1761012 RepID=A0A3G1KYH1_FORW1|nr:CoA-binding protein [Candidatus Formimonas warabiya]ATW27437.1 hypothetical protein DCMF_24175 [Candidatus Formimonas warabiya]
MDHKQSLDALFKAKSIAILGASSKAGKLGHRVVENAKAMDFSGEIYPVNPGSKEILGLKCYKSLEEISGKVDIAVMVLNAEECIKAAEEIARRRDRIGDINGVVVISSGFSEMGDETGRSREKALLAPLLERGIRVIGPNCLGIIDTYHGVNTTFEIGNCPKGGVSIVSQSGAFAQSCLRSTEALGTIGINKFVAMGNMKDVDVSELIEYLGDDARTNVIALYLEGTKDARKLMTTAAEVTKRKPIVSMKPGKTELGSRAAQSHTGSIAGSFAMYKGAFRQAGIVQTFDVPEFYHTIAAMDKTPLPKGNRVCVLTVVGGPGTICIDELMSSGVAELAKLSPETKTGLKKILAPTANIGLLDGYIDMTGSVNEEIHHEVFKILIADPQIDAIIFITPPPTFLDAELLANKIVSAYQSFPEAERKTLLSVFVNGFSAADCRKILEKNSMPTLEYPDTAAKVMTNMIRYSQYRSKNSK